MRIYAMYGQRNWTKILLSILVSGSVGSSVVLYVVFPIHISTNKSQRTGVLKGSLGESIVDY